jgi:hypothetical protein
MRGFLAKSSENPLNSAAAVPKNTEFVVSD